MSEFSLSIDLTLRFSFDRRRVKATLTLHVTGSQALSGWIVLASATSLVLCALAKAFDAQLRFIWHAFIAPIGSADQRGRLEKVIVTFHRPLHHHHHHISNQCDVVLCRPSGRLRFDTKRTLEGSQDDAEYVSSSPERTPPICAEQTIGLG